MREPRGEPDYPPEQLAAWREGRACGQRESFWHDWWYGAIAGAAAALILVQFLT